MAKFDFFTFRAWQPCYQQTTFFSFTFLSLCLSCQLSWLLRRSLYYFFREWRSKKKYQRQKLTAKVFCLALFIPFLQCFKVAQKSAFYIQLNQKVLFFRINVFVFIFFHNTSSDSIKSRISIFTVKILEFAKRNVTFFGSEEVQIYCCQGYRM